MLNKSKREFTSKLKMLGFIFLKKGKKKDLLRALILFLQTFELILTL